MHSFFFFFFFFFFWMISNHSGQEPDMIEFLLADISPTFCYSLPHFMYTRIPVFSIADTRTPPPWFRQEVRYIDTSVLH